MRWNVAPRRARDDAMRRSHASASARPAPTQLPSMDAMIGCARLAHATDHPGALEQPVAPRGGREREAIGHRLDVATGAEVVARTDEDEHAHRRIGAGAGDRLVERAPLRGTERVAGRGAIERERRDGVVDGVTQAHGVSAAAEREVGGELEDRATREVLVGGPEREAHIAHAARGDRALLGRRDRARGVARDPRLGEHERPRRVAGVGEAHVEGDRRTVPLRAEERRAEAAILDGEGVGRGQRAARVEHRVPLLRGGRGRDHRRCDLRWHGPQTGRGRVTGSGAITKAPPSTDGDKQQDGDACQRGAAR